MNYNEFLESKIKRYQNAGFEVSESDLNPNLFDFQKHIVKKALLKGRYAIFADCGLGKTLMQLSFADAVTSKENRKFLIVTPLSVKGQTIKEASKFEIDTDMIDFCHYEDIKNIDVSIYCGVCLDESSVLKNSDGKFSNELINLFSQTKYKLACSATPSPNDHIELGMHSEFLGYKSRDEIKSTYFIQDHKIKNGSKWRLKKHAIDDFWSYISTFSISVDDPSSLGFDSSKYNLPKLNLIEHVIEIPNNTGNLFGDSSVTATSINKDLRNCQQERILKCKSIVSSSDRSFIVWATQNKEAEILAKEINDAFNVHGSLKKEIKASKLIGFAESEYRVLVSKTKIAGFGMNYQNCSDMVFCSYNFSFEQFYQAVRRCYRFGQNNEVNVHILIPSTQKNVINTIKRKIKDHKERIKSMIKNNNNISTELNSESINDVNTDKFSCLYGDCIERIKEIKSNSIGYSFFSPPFASLYTYSDDARDMSNVDSDKEFMKQFSFLSKELLRVIKPGRIVSMHIMQGTTSIGNDGFLSIKDLRGDLIRLMQDSGFYFHAEKMIRKNPQLAAVRTKNIQLMHGQTKRDSSINRPGLADYIISFRKPGQNTEKIKNEIPFDLWCKLAEPVWMDINESDVIKFRDARGKNDERHMTPTQLTAIRNCMMLWSNKGDKFLTPFAGCGSETKEAIEYGMFPISIELKPTYFNKLVSNCKNTVSKLNQQTLF